MKNSYHRMPLSPKLRPLTTMVIPGNGLYQCKGMPMGFQNANAQFQRMMEWVLKDLPFADVYVDDVIIGFTGETEQELPENHAKHLDEVLDFLRDTILSRSCPKCLSPALSSSVTRSSRTGEDVRNPAS